MFNFDEINRRNKDVVDGMLQGYSELAKSFQAIATETGDYSRKSMKDATAFVEAVGGAKSVEAVYELQTTYMKSAYEEFVAEADRIGTLYADLAKSVYGRFDVSVPWAPVARAPVAKTKPTTN
ncbi:phasin family protein [Neorhizobium alkalisoli]|jgi:hypothetical protein|uniref:Phasin protein n=1 Tax=Neorhizobium alkalisoli TaxID=528178 RepID=A0A561QHM2_9HYPH|nr:phasin family protein [Neorhizobium alkalisoli]TWF49864.1 phasin protein [Neorhizobium alkalisoli]